MITFLALHALVGSFFRFGFFVVSAMSASADGKFFLHAVLLSVCRPLSVGFDGVPVALDHLVFEGDCAVEGVC